MVDRIDYSTEFSDLLAKSVPIVQKPPKTFMEIAGYPHYENVVSNILQFFFSPEEEHNLKDLFLHSLLSCLNNKRSTPFRLSSPDCRVEREMPGLQQTRIDILIYTGDNPKSNDGDAIIIECKIWAQLYNSLDLYWDAITKSNKAGIVLSLNKEPGVTHTGFVNITFDEFVNEIMASLEKYLNTATDKYIIFLHDFLLNLSSLKPNTLMSEYYKFYYEHAEKVNKLAKMRDEITRDIRNCVITTGYELGYKTNGIAYHYRYWLIEGTSEVYFTFLIPEAYTESDNRKLMIFLELQGNMLLKENMFISDPELRLIAESGGLQLSKIQDGGSFMRIMAKELEMNAEIMINLKAHLMTANKVYIEPVYNRVRELLKHPK